MFVKQIIIQGFKSYKDQTVIEPFSPKHNVIVGRNGSGKSNFFAAIRFVLSDAYTHMGREERQALLHEGSGSAVMSAYVEIIFDNSDERFPTGKNELILRRTIGLKKDEYTLDRKNATKADVMNLLESAGFSRSNPYYIVPQGRVTTLTNMKDSERLVLLKEVAGTQVYEARRAESLKIMNETNNKIAKIDELLDYINERLGELEEEKDELKNFQEKDRERRCLEYTIYSREQAEIAAALENIENQRQTGVEDTDANRNKFIQGENDIAQIDAEIAERKQQIELLKVERTQLEDDRRDASRVLAQAELQGKSLAEGQSAAQQAKARRETELSTVQNAIKEREAELNKLTPQFNALKEEEEVSKAKLTEAETTRQRLYAKQGRISRFRNKSERDKWLQKEIQDTYTSLSTVKAVRMQTAEEITDLENEIALIEPETEKLRKQFDGRGDAMQSMEQEVQRAKDERDSLMDQRKELWREEAKLDSILSNASQEVDRAERNLSHMMDHNTSRGIAAVRRIKRQYNLDGVYGTMAELFEVSDRYRTAVEVTAGHSLFHYVVDTDDTATKVLEILQKEKSGRVTFMPLNRLKPRPANLPRASDTIPMIEKLQYDSKYEKAFQQVFGRTIICPNLQVASQYARSHGVNAITPEGDRSDKRGALTGGFHDSRVSRLDAMKTLTKWRDELEAKGNRGAEIRRELDKMDQLITRAVGELQKLEQRRQQIQGSNAPLRQEIKSKRDLLHNKADTLEAKRRALKNIEANVNALTDQVNAHEEELSTPFEKALTNDEEARLENLSSAVQDLRRQHSELSSKRSEIETRKSILEVELRENLHPRLDQLIGHYLDGGDDTIQGNLKESQRQIKKQNKELEKLNRRLEQLEDSIEEKNNEASQLEQRKAEIRRELDELSKSIERHQRRMEKSMQKKAALTKQATECSANIRALGVLPDEAFTKFKNADSNTVVKRLHKVNEALKKYSHVNKKAFEQYNNFTKQRETLMKRREELDASHKSIDELIMILDQRKDEAIERTFKQVSREFAKIFEKLVPAGRGRLIIQRKTDPTNRQDDDIDSDEEEARRSVENYVGVGISVSFNSKHDEQQRIQQLSGGQKSLCALALVFAIQACDPAPFYLFDEIDANLDAQYRTAVAQMLKSISEETNGQFICTTFRPEMLHVAEKCYGVSFRNKASTIDVVSREEALKFVEEQKT
ncbi:chromosome segregation protein sudA [Coccidioides immitis RS]|uniref:Structural maintenance of chromosomes protein n=4 Tax=Coccidioides TaxID=5500 RepID=J3KF79_COCIM|nr:chromosome segregation protein sudA [Coccidioides immitis RS]EAS34253.3 chromosome segregation protein sudA [Coccidioides immitis RS]EFW17595.1 chromosome segregation protein sudA [Coccidioides posadasii str. Silveira]KMM70763.1 structural maintenance of chromosomes protein 3 [Coccidioides posadasii RMSCC 3488]